MKHLLIAAAALIVLLPILGPSPSSAQSMDDLKLQVHGYATQAFIYSTNNNWDTTDSTDGSAAWTEAVVNVTAQPESKLRIGMQARYYLLGNYGNAITLDWAQADYKFNEHLGFRVGKVKTPIGLLNETQDIDPSMLWVILPQSVYPLASRTSILAHFGAVAYGDVPLGESMGKLEYHVYGGASVIGGGDGFFQFLRDSGLTLPNGVTGPLLGAALKWHTPIEGLILGASDSFEHPSGEIVAGPMQGTTQLSKLNIPYFFGKFERKKLMVAGEYNRMAVIATIQFPGAPPLLTYVDPRTFYVIASYKITGKLGGGIYYSSSIDRKAALGSARYQKDWALSSRYDFNPYLYLKAEQHFVDGTAIGDSTATNPDGLCPNSRMTLLKLGMIF